MRVRAIDVNNDWLFGKGQNDYKTGLDALAQTIKTRLQSFLNDCFFDKQGGIDWFNLLGAKNQLAIDIAVSSCLLNTEGVSGINRLSIDLNTTTRNIVIVYSVTNSLGLTVNGQVTSADLLITEDGDIITTEGEDPIVVF